VTPKNANNTILSANMSVPAESRQAVSILKTFSEEAADTAADHLLKTFLICSAAALEDKKSKGLRGAAIFIIA
jgi:hypothetical protein